MFHSASLRGFIPPIKPSRSFITRDDVVQRLKFGSAFLSYSGSQKLSCFFNFPVSRARLEKIVSFLLAATLNHVQVRLDCTSRTGSAKKGKVSLLVLTGFLIYSQKPRMSRIYYLRSRSSLGRFAA